MRRVVVLLFAAIGILSTAVWARDVPVTFPSRARVKIVGVVDEMGNLLFGSTPGKVEVTNFPATTDPGEVFNVMLQVYTPSVVTTVPVGEALIITDIDGSYSCANANCQLSDSTGVRLTWYVGSNDGQNMHHSYTTGVRFGPGETVSSAAPTTPLSGLSPSWVDSCRCRSSLPATEDVPRARTATARERAATPRTCYLAAHPAGSARARPTSW